MRGQFTYMRCAVTPVGWHNLPRMLLATVLALFAINTVSAKTTGVVVTGLGGNEEYAEKFLSQGQVVVDALRTVSESDDDIVLIQAQQATRENILQSITTQAALGGDVFFLIMLGHGTVDAESWRFNLPGIDITTQDLVAALTDVDAPEQIVLLGASASGAVLDVLSQPGRYVVTATKSAGELNAVRFPEYLSKAMEASLADTDRNEILTLAEVYRYANEKTQGYYDEQNLLASEHARISGDQPERVAMARLGALKLANDDPEVKQLLQERLILEDAFLELKAAKPDMQTGDYYEQLEPLLISIAKLQQKIDAATGWVESNE